MRWMPLSFELINDFLSISNSLDIHNIKRASFLELNGAHRKASLDFFKLQGEHLFFLVGSSEVRVDLRLNHNRLQNLLA